MKLTIASFTITRFSNQRPTLIIFFCVTEKDKQLSWTSVTNTVNSVDNAIRP